LVGNSVRVIKPNSSYFYKTGFVMNDSGLSTLTISLGGGRNIRVATHSVMIIRAVDAGRFPDPPKVIGVLASRPKILKEALNKCRDKLSTELHRMNVSIASKSSIAALVTYRPVSFVEMTALCQVVDIHRRYHQG
jgi:hypothetical protein